MLVGVGLPLAVRLHEGVTPTNDEWSYAKAAIAMHTGHGIALQGFNQMFLIGQLVASQPFLSGLGLDVTSLAVLGAAAAVLWLGAVLALTRPMLGTARALLLVLAIAVSPIFALLSSSFMTDIPAAASASIALLVSVRAMERVSAWRFVVALVMTVVAFTFREQAIAVFITLLIAVVTRWPQLTRRFRAFAAGSMSLCFLTCLVLEQLRHGLPHGDAPPFGLASIHVLSVPDSLVRGSFTVALLLAPLMVFLPFAPRTSLRRTVLVGTCIAAVGTLLLFNGPGSSVLLGNYLERNGAYANALVGSAPPVFGSVMWPVLQVAAIVAATRLCCEVYVRARTRRRRLSLREVPIRNLMVYGHCVVLTVICLGLAFLGEHQYDRYVLPLLPAVGAFLLSRPGHDVKQGTATEKGAGAALFRPVLCCVPMLMLSVVLTVTTFARDRAVWRSASWLTAHGVAPTSINAGSAWDGWHATTPLLRNEQPNLVQYSGDVWAQRFPRSADCYVVSLSTMPRSDWRLVRVARARPYGTRLDTIPVYTYRRVGGQPFGEGLCLPRR